MDLTSYFRPQGCEAPLLAFYETILYNFYYFWYTHYQNIMVEMGLNESNC